MTERPDAAVIVTSVLARPARLFEGRLLCIDGPAGSGKTTVAAAVAADIIGRDLSAAVLHMDDLYEGWKGLDLGGEQRLISQVIEPLSRGHAARWQRYDWYAEQFDEWVDQPPVDVLVMEGCGSGALLYAAHRTLLVWVEAGGQTRIRRGLARDGEQVLPRWLAWMESEDRHFAANQTKQHADLVYSTD